MKILICSQYFWPENFRINDLTKGLIEKGHDVTVLTAKPNYSKGRIYTGYNPYWFEQADFHSAKVFRTPIIPRRNNSKLRLVMNYASFVMTAGLYGLLKCRQHYDAILVYGMSPITQAIPAILLKRLTKSPLVLYVQDLWPESLQAVGAIISPRLLNLVKRMVRWIYQNSDRILVQSSGFVSPITTLGTRNEKITYLPNSTEDFYRPLSAAEAIDEKKLMPNGFRIVFAGNLGLAQDFPTIINCARQLKNTPEIKFIFIGDGTERKNIAKDIKKYALEETCFMLGRYPAEKMPHFFAHADALLVTLKDKKIFEYTIPSKLQSYFACQKPVIAALKGSGAEIIHQANAGFVCSPGDATGLSDIILQLYSLNAQDRLQLGVNGKRYFDKYFSRQEVMDRLEAALQFKPNTTQNLAFKS